MSRRYLGAGADDPEFLADNDAERFFVCALVPERTLSWDWT